MVRAKVGRQMEERVPVWVIAATNDERRLSPELRSRFAVRTLRSYSRDEYYSVIKGVLVRREGISEELAQEIAKALDGRSVDVRDAVRVARLTPQVGVEKAVKLLLNK